MNQPNYLHAARWHLALLLGFIVLPVAMLRAEEPQKPGAEHSKIESLRFHGEDYFAVELDGYGIPTDLHFSHRQKQYFSNPHVSQELPKYYRVNGLPVAYRRNAVMEIELTVDPALVAELGTKELRIVGSGRATIGGKPFAVQFTGKGQRDDGKLTFQTKADKALPNHVGHVEPFKLSWSLEAGGKKVALGDSRNPLYVTLETPVQPSSILFAQAPHTALALSCRAAAGATDRETVLNKVWGQFQSREVKRARDGAVLKYYGGHYDGRVGNAHSEFFGFLMCGAGQCQTWAALMAYSLSVHGIDSRLTHFSKGVKFRIDMKGWRFIDGTTFILSGADGICQTVAQGDDLQEIPEKQGLPETVCVKALTTQKTIQFIPGDFKLPYQRGYRVVDKEHVKLSGDDVFQHFAKHQWVLNGADGILQTVPQPGLTAVKNSSHRYPSAGKVVEFREKQPLNSDDWMIDDVAIYTGKDGICQTQAKSGKQWIKLGQGLPNCVAISPGKNGKLDTTPVGDDIIVDISPWLKHTAKEYQYVNGVNAIPPLVIPAQSNQYSPPSFPNHMILSIGGKFYDPSYGGGPFESYKDFEQKSIGGVSTGLRNDQDQFIRVADIPWLNSNWWHSFQVQGSVVHAHRKNP